jgi:hypothetical protein
MRVILTWPSHRPALRSSSEKRSGGTLDPTAHIPNNVDAVAVRDAAAAPRYGMEYLIE